MRVVLVSAGDKCRLLFIDTNQSMIRIYSFDRLRMGLRVSLSRTLSGVEPEYLRMETPSLRLFHCAPAQGYSVRGRHGSLAPCGELVESAAVPLLIFTNKIFLHISAFCFCGFCCPWKIGAKCDILLLPCSGYTHSARLR